MSNSKSQNQTLIDRRFGFEIMLINPPMMKVRGEWVADLNANHLRTAVLAGLTTKPGPLSGAEVRFIRLWMEHTTTAFGRALGVTHSAVLKWEKKEQAPTGMNRATEFRLRVLILRHLPASAREQIVLRHQSHRGTQELGLDHLLQVLDELWTEASIENPSDTPLQIPHELVAQQSLQRLRSHGPDYS